MNYIKYVDMKKLKTDNSVIGLVPSVLALLIFALVSSLYSLEIGFDALGVVVLLYSVLLGFWYYVKTKNYFYLVSFTYMIVFGVFLLILEPGMLKRYGGKLDSQAAFVFILVLFLLIWLLFILVNKKLKWRGREIMELAAINVEPETGSYTDRPRPKGVISATKSDIIQFSKYLKKKLIFMTYIEEDKVILVPVKMSHEFRIMYKQNINSIAFTRIFIDFEGNVSVHISKADYLDYKEDLSFHHLCEALGNLVIDFYDLYVNNEEVRIMDKLNSVKVGYFT